MQLDQGDSGSVHRRTSSSGGNSSSNSTDSASATHDGSPSERELLLQALLSDAEEARDIALEECRRLQDYGKRGLETGEAGSIRVQQLNRELADAMARIEELESI